MLDLFASLPILGTLLQENTCVSSTHHRSSCCRIFYSWTNRSIAHSNIFAFQKHLKTVILLFSEFRFFTQLLSWSMSAICLLMFAFQNWPSQAAFRCHRIWIFDSAVLQKQGNVWLSCSFQKFPRRICLFTFSPKQATIPHRMQATNLLSCWVSAEKV